MDMDIDIDGAIVKEAFEQRVNLGDVSENAAAVFAHH
jgi:hypothetical protein